MDEFVVTQENSHITQLVMHKWHLWGQKDVITPFSALSPMGDTHEDSLFLKLNKQCIEYLPIFPIHMRSS